MTEQQHALTAATRAHQSAGNPDVAAFLRNGYLGTSMDDIAAEAAVSKQTVYKHFADKQGLFTDMILSTIDEGAEAFADEISALEGTEDLDKDLTDVARRLINVVMQPAVLQLLRLVTGEAGRFPQLARAVYARGPGRTIVGLAPWFQRLAARGLLRIDDPLLAAGQLQLAGRVDTHKQGHHVGQLPRVQRYGPRTIRRRWCPGLP